MPPPASPMPDINTTPHVSVGLHISFHSLCYAPHLCRNGLMGAKRRFISIVRHSRSSCRFSRRSVDLALAVDALVTDQSNGILI